MNFELFQFLRPLWLLALLPFLFLSIWIWRQQARQSRWRRIIAPELQEYLLSSSTQQKTLWPIILLMLTGLLAIIALAGPTWERLPQPVFRQDSALVIVLDLSRSMDAQDIKPSRLQRARFKIRDILKERREGQTALIVYAADAFTVSPLTDDDPTIIAQLPALTTSLPPAQGSRVDRALELAVQLLKQSSLPQGNVLLLTDEISTAAGLNAAQQVLANGYRLSILGIGTNEGAPIPVQGGMLKNQSGEIVIARLDTDNLERIASAGGGEYANLRLDNRDIKRLGILESSRLDDGKQDDDSELNAEIWREVGPWLLLPVLPLVAMAFRRGLLVIALIILIPLPRPADALDWQQQWKNLWQTPDQQGQQLLQTRKPEAAAQRFRTPEWRASANYRAGKYEEALSDFEALPGAEARYNEGNTLAKLGKLEEAIQSYNHALELDPDNEDAIYNRKLIEDLLKQQQEQQQQNDQNQDDQQQDSDQQQSSSDPQQNQSQDQDSSENESTEKGDSGNEAEASQSAENQQGNTSEQQQDAQSGEQPDQRADQTQSGDEEQPHPASQASNSEQQDMDRQWSQGEESADGEAQGQLPQLTDEEELARDQWLQRIPDDPAGLLKRKFEYQYRQRARQDSGGQTW